MATPKVPKKRVVTSFNNLAPELQEQVSEKYSNGFTDAMMRIDKPNGDFFYAVSFATDDVDYMIKIDVKIDDANHDDDDKGFFGDEIKDGDELADIQDADDDDDDM